MLKKLLSTAQVAQMAGTREHNVQYAARTGQLEHYRSNRSVFAFDQEMVDKWKVGGKGKSAPARRLYSPRQVARRIDYSHTWILALLKNGSIDGYTVGEFGGYTTYLLDRNSICQLMERRNGQKR